MGTMEDTLTELTSTVQDNAQRAGGERLQQCPAQRRGGGGGGANHARHHRQLAQAGGHYCGDFRAIALVECALAAIKSGAFSAGVRNMRRFGSEDL